MVSALRQRASQPSAKPAAGGRLPVVDDSVEFTTPLRANRLKIVSHRRGRWFDLRRLGLGVSIAGAMAASAIGGALLAHAGSAPATGSTQPVEPVQSVHAAGSAADAASVVRADSGLPAAAASEAPVPAHGESHAAPRVESHAEAASAAPAPSHVEEAKPVPPPAPTLAADLTFGLDLNGDGIPDSLERFVRKTINAPATRVAARHYYRVVLPLAAKVQLGETLPHGDRQAVFRAAECYYLSAAEDGLADAPNLNDRASLIGVAAADRMQALSESLQGFDYRVGGVKRLACG